jgi:hypothetical protein
MPPLPRIVGSFQACDGVTSGCRFTAVGASVANVPPWPSAAMAKLDAMQLPRSATLAVWVPSVTDTMPPGSLLFSEKPNVVWPLKWIPGRIYEKIACDIKRENRTWRSEMEALPPCGCGDHWCDRSDDRQRATRSPANPLGSPESFASPEALSIPTTVAGQPPKPMAASASKNFPYL